MARRSMSTKEMEQAIDVALSRLGIRNGHFEFEKLCVSVARVAISPSILLSTGPVAGGGDGGVDISSYPTWIDGSVTPEFARLGVLADQLVLMTVTTQRRDLEGKFLSDVRKIVATGLHPDWVFGFFSEDIVEAKKQRLVAAVDREFGVRSFVFDRAALVQVMATHWENLKDDVRGLLGVSDFAEQSIPFRAPPPPARFVNRDGELSKLDSIAASAVDSGTCATVLVTGMPGVGKSALARSWAAKRRESFAGGVLFADLAARRRGDSVDVSEVLADFLRDLGVADAAIPATLSQRRREFQAATARRAVLVVVDDARLDSHVEALVPAGGGSVVLATSRFRMDGLIASGAESIGVAPLDDGMSAMLLELFLGSDRVARESSNISVLLNWCGGLPLALSVCGGVLASRPNRTTSWILEAISSTPTRRLPSSDDRLSVLLTATVDELSLAAQSMYSLLSVMPCESFTIGAAAAIAGFDNGVAARVLDELEMAHLVDAYEADRFGQHSMVHRHSQELAAVRASPADLFAARDRMVSWYLEAAHNADVAVVAERIRLPGRTVRHVENAIRPSSPKDAAEWFATERVHIGRVVQAAFDAGLFDEVFEFAQALWPLCASHRYFDPWIPVHELATEACVLSGEVDRAARVLSQLARGYAAQGDRELCDETLRRVHDLLDGVTLPSLRASLIEFEGVCRLELGDAAEGLPLFRRARSGFEAVGLSRGVALQDYYSAVASLALGDFEAAKGFALRAEPVLASFNDVISVARCRRCHGSALIGEGVVDVGLERLDSAVKLFESAGSVFEAAVTCELLGDVCESSGDLVAGRVRLQQAARLYKVAGHPKADSLVERLAG